MRFSVEKAIDERPQTSQSQAELAIVKRARKKSINCRCGRPAGTFEFIAGRLADRRCTRCAPPSVRRRMSLETRQRRQQAIELGLKLDAARAGYRTNLARPVTRPSLHARLRQQGELERTVPRNLRRPSLRDWW